MNDLEKLAAMMLNEREEKKKREEFESAKKLYEMMGEDYNITPLKEETTDEAIAMLKKINN